MAKIKFLIRRWNDKRRRWRIDIAERKIIQILRFLIQIIGLAWKSFIVIAIKIRSRGRTAANKIICIRLIIGFRFRRSADFIWGIDELIRGVRKMLWVWFWSRWIKILVVLNNAWRYFLYQFSKILDTILQYKMVFFILVFFPTLI